MKREDDQQLWDLLGQSAEPKVSPFFARNVLREIRQKPARRFFIQWLSARTWVPAAGVALAVIAAVLIRMPGSVSESPGSRTESYVMSDGPDSELIADLDDLVASDDNNPGIDSALL